MVKTFKPRGKGAGKPAYKKKATAAKRKPMQRRKPARHPRPTLAGSSGNMVRNPGGGSCSTSTYAHNIPPTKQVKNFEYLGAPNIGFQNRVLSIQSQSGGQAYQSFDIATAGLARQIAALVPDGTATGRSPWRFCLQETLDTFHFTNATSGTVEVDLYDLFPKRDIPDSYVFIPPGQLPSTTNSYLLSGTVDSYWKQGARMSSQIAADASLSIEPSEQYNASPDDSVFFKTFYRAVKRTRIFLPQGASHKHTVMRHINRVINTTEVGGDAYSQLKRFTSSLLVVVRGEPLDAVDPAGGPNVITTAVAKLQVVQTARFKWTWISDQAMTNYISSNLRQFTVTKNINPATGTDEVLTVLKGTGP